MNKRLFLLFAIYLLVIQMGLIGYFMHQPFFYQLAVINAGVLVLFSIFYCLFSKKKTINNKETSILKEKGEKSELPQETEIRQENFTFEVEENPKEEENQEETKEENKEETPKKEKKNTYAETMLRNDVKQKAQPTTKKRHKKIYYGQWIIFILSLIIAVAVFYIAYEFLSERAYVLASFMGFLAYVILGKMLDVAGFHKIRALFTAWIYYLILLFSLLYTGVMKFGEEELIKKIDQYIPITQLKNFDFLKYVTLSSEEEETQTGSKFEDNHFQLGDGIILQYQPVNLQSGTDTTITTGDNINETGTNNENTITVPEPTLPEVIQEYTMLDAIKYLLTSNNITLSQKKTTKFDHIAQTDENYQYFQTAFDKKLIGKNTNPNVKISCDTYIVMKGLVEGRAIGTYSDIKTAYRNKAETLNKLNGCVKGAIVTSKTL